MSDASLTVFETRVPGLDEVLDGGLWRGSVYLLEGLPGTGKTILANQIAFAKASEGERVLYVSLISESQGKLVHHLRRMRFFDERLVGGPIDYMSGYRSLVDEGLQGLFDFILGHTRERKASFLVLEGFSSAEYVKRDILEFAQFLHRLNALAASLRCTILLVCHDQGTDDHPEHTLVDGVIELSRVSREMRTARFLKVHKARGRDPVLGEHAFKITDAGVEVFPRLEAVATRDTTPPDSPELARERAPFGVAGLDRMLHGGLVGGGATAILGAPGAGKTLLGVKFLEDGLKRGDRALLFGFYESPERLVEKAAGVGIDLRSGLEQGRLRLLWQPPLEYAPDELAWKLLGAIAEHRPRRVLIDGIAGFAAASFHRQDLTMFLAALTNRLRASRADTVITEELALAGFGRQEIPHLISPVVDNVILLRHREVRGRMCRLVSMLKVRESDYDQQLKELTISDAGIAVRDLPEVPAPDDTT